MEKLKEMDESGNRPSAGKIDELMENLVKTGCAVCTLLFVISLNFCFHSIYPSQHHDLPPT